MCAARQLPDEPPLPDLPPPDDDPFVAGPDPRLAARDRGLATGAASRKELWARIQFGKPTTGLGATIRTWAPCAPADAVAP